MIRNSPAQAIDTSERIRRALSAQSAYSEGAVIGRPYRFTACLVDETGAGTPFNAHALLGVLPIWQHEPQ